MATVIAGFGSVDPVAWSRHEAPASDFWESMEMTDILVVVRGGASVVMVSTGPSV